VKKVSASVTKTAFSCPHCGAYTTQFWYAISPHSVPRDDKLPSIWTTEKVNRLKENTPEGVTDEQIKAIEKLSFGEIEFHERDDPRYCKYDINNLHLSKCYSCQKHTIWVHEKIVYPSEKIDIEPNSDLSDDIKRDFSEAREIISSSPRGASALLRLCIQKLCIELGEKGKDLNTDIANLVKKGLNVTIQKSLDIVRVIGNESVHPGIMDMRDDRDTAIKLFELVNIIAEQLISQPRRVKEIYESLPDSKKQSIENRDK